MPREGTLPGECAADDADMEMATSVARTGVTDVTMAVVADVELIRRQRGPQRGADPLDAAGSGLAHGSTGRNGRTLTSR